MTERDNLSWFNGPVTHVHLKLDGEAKEGNSGEDIQFTHDTALMYLRKLSNNPFVRITDTGHAMLSFNDIDNLKRPDNETLQEWRTKIINQASRETIRRVAEIRKTESHIVVGVEADIIDSSGHLSLDDECLEKIDFTIASFHRFIWTVFSERTHYESDELINMYLGTLDNPSVSVLGHPIRSSSKRIGTIEFGDFVPVLHKMKEKKVAYEVDILANLSDESERLNLKVIKECSKLNVPVVFGIDFHSFENIGFVDNISSRNRTVDKQNLDNVFSQNRDVHFRIFRRLIKNIHTLQDLGVRRDQVVNSSDQVFDQWLKERKLLKA